MYFGHVWQNDPKNASITQVAMRYALYSNNGTIVRIPAMQLTEPVLRFDSLYQDIPGATIYEINYAYDHKNWVYLHDLPRWIRNQLNDSLIVTTPEAISGCESNCRIPTETLSFMFVVALSLIAVVIL